MALVTTGLILACAVLAIALVWVLMSNAELRDDVAAEHRICQRAVIDRCALQRDRDLMAAAEHLRQQMREAWDEARNARRAEVEAHARIAELEAELRADDRADDPDDDADPTAEIVIFTADGRLVRGPGGTAAGEAG